MAGLKRSGSRERVDRRRGSMLTRPVAAAFAATAVATGASGLKGHTTRISADGVTDFYYLVPGKHLLAHGV